MLKLSTFVLSSLFFSSTASAFTVGIAFPTQDETRWYKEGFYLQDTLKSKGYNVELFYGGDYDVDLQKKQITRLANSNIDVLVVAALDGGVLGNQLALAKQKRIPIISYDRLITGTDNVDYYAAFDNLIAGQMQGQFIIDSLDLDNASSYDPKYIEIFSGSLDDNNSKFFYDGAMKLLQPYIDDGSLVIPSNETSLSKTQITGWKTDNAIKRMESLINSQGYGPNKKKLDAILSAADCLTDGIVKALDTAGYKLNEMPYVTGQDATPDAINRIKNGFKGMTIEKPAKILAQEIVEMVDAIRDGREVPYNDSHTYDNGAKVVNSYLGKPVLVTKSNIAQY